MAFPLRVTIRGLSSLGFGGLEAYRWIQKPTVLRVLPSIQGVTTRYFVGFGVTGKP